MANEAYRGGQKGLQAVASAIEALRCDFVAKDDIREAGLEELNGKVDALDQFWMDLQIPGGMKPAVGSTTGDLVLGMGPPTVVSDAVSKERNRIYQLRRKKLVGIYEKHNPEKLAEVDTILERYEGRESLLFELLEKKYTMDVAFATPANRVAAERDRIHQLRRKKLVGIYEKHNPEKLKDVDELLRAYAGRESELFEKLEKKYYAAEVAFSAKAIGASGAVQRVGDLNSQLSKLNAGDDDY